MRLRQCKDKINALNEELSIRISCFKESQLQVQSFMLIMCFCEVCGYEENKNIIYLSAVLL